MLLLPLLFYSELLAISTSRVVSRDPEPIRILLLFPVVALFYRPLQNIIRYVGYIYEVIGKKTPL